MHRPKLSQQEFITSYSTYALAGIYAPEEELTLSGVNFNTYDTFYYTCLKTLTLIDCSCPPSSFLSSFQCINLHLLGSTNMPSDFTYTLKNLQELTIPVNQNNAFSIRSIYLSKTSWLSLLNNIKDNTASTAKTLALLAGVYDQLQSYFVKKIEGIYTFCAKTDNNAINFIEAILAKNWTISISDY